MTTPTQPDYDRQRQLLEELSNVPGPTGHEGAVRSIVRREMTPLADSLETDGLGSLIAEFRATDEGAPTVMLAAHMDELGLMIRRITPEGFLTFQTLGGWLDQALVNQRWTVMTRNGPVPAVSGIKTVHVMQPDERDKIFARKGLFLDVGAADKEDAENRLSIRPGDPVAPDSRFQELAGGRCTSARRGMTGQGWQDSSKSRGR